jgi:asparagine synthase (glutamine-hydrolysing)
VLAIDQLPLDAEGWLTMCGVVGVYAYSASAPVVDREELRKVRDHMAARGPDGAGEWYSADERVGLGHRRLSIIDLSERAAQPMASADGTVVISFNGEIYNYRELRAELQARGRTFRTESDTEVLLALYEEHGTGMLDKLRGMFAFALWDGRKRAMLLARDPFGIKPLYYANDGKTVRAASQVKALLHAPVDTSPEPAGHAGFFLWGSVPGPWTLYRGIRSLPPGHFMWVREQGAHEPEPYCLITDILAQAAAEPARGSREEALDQISAALRESVKAHLVADVPVGIFLSGGLDSAMLASLAAATGARPRTITLAFEEYAGTADDEAPLAQSLARQLGTEHSTIVVRRAHFEAQREELLAAMDQPSIDGVNTWLVARAAAAQGLKVALSGLGGDELFGSYPSFHDVPRIHRLARPFVGVPALGALARRFIAPLLPGAVSPKYAGLLEYGATLGGAYLLRRGLYMPWELPRLMDPEMARAGWQDLRTVARLNGTCSRVSSTRPDHLSISALEMSWYMRHQLLNDSDWAGMGHSVEIRLPMVDVPFLKAAAPWLAAHPKLTKRDIAKAAAPQIPAALLNKDKTGFLVPVGQWLGAGASPRRASNWACHVHARYASVRARRPRVLVSTLAPGDGGVSAMTRFVVQQLTELGFEPVVAHYAPYSVAPAMSVPVFRLFQRTPGSQRSRNVQNCETYAIGAWLPELEFTHYAATRPWRELMASCDAYVAASGNVLVATPFWQTGRPYLAWVATDWDGDRKDRVKQFPMPRRMVDTLVNAPVIRQLEKRLLLRGTVLSLSEHTARVLRDRAGPAFRNARLPVAIDTDLFVPSITARVPGRLGFAGRFSDPRKNIGLLLEALAELRKTGTQASLVLMGGTQNEELRQQVTSLGLEKHVLVKSDLSRVQMRDWLQTLDVFVLPSHQEGLCISALEAMACSVPVVSTRCGGPEEFVIQGVTGCLVDPCPRNMARAVASIIGDAELRSRLALSARSLVEQRYTRAPVEAAFRRALAAAFPRLDGEWATEPAADQLVVHESLA